MVLNRTLRRWPIVLAMLALACLVAAVFHPILGSSFLTMDVSQQVVNNPNVHGLSAENISHILTSTCITSYYPVRTLTFALDYETWGLNPSGYKLTGGLIHLANVLLVFWLIARLLGYRTPDDELARRKYEPDLKEVAVATFAAGVFAIHPVVVEPVTWVAGREELLMTLGALGCFHFHLSARRAIREGRHSARATAYFVVAALSCAFGCLSNAVGAVIPALITAWDLLTLPKPKLGRILRGTSALWLIGVAAFAAKIMRPGAPAAELPWAIVAKQPLIALIVYWLNIKTLAWPTKLALCYPVIFPDELDVAQLTLGGLVAAATCILLWKVRWHTPILFGLLWFCLALAPVSQIMPHHVHRADRFLYLPLVGLAIATATALSRVHSFARRPAAMTAAAVAGLGVLLLLSVLAARQVQRWQDDLTVWEHCVVVAPNNSQAHGFLADVLQSAGKTNRAAASYRKALELNPDNVAVLNNFAVCLTSGAPPRLDDHRLAVTLAERGCRLTEWRDPDLVHALARAHTALANTYKVSGRYRLAIDHYYQAIDTDAECDLALFNLALLLSTCRDETLREPNKAVQLAERGRQVANPLDAHRLGILAVAYGEVGRFKDAATVTREAIEAAQKSGDHAELELLREYLQLFAKGQPLTVPSGSLLRKSMLRVEGALDSERAVRAVESQGRRDRSRRP